MFISIFLLFFWINNILSVPVRVSELNKSWSLKNQNESIIINGINLPSGVYSAYSTYKSLPVDSVLLSKNDINMRWIAHDNWNYYLNFYVSNEDIENTQFINLTFHGIDTISTIKLNGHRFYTDNMFVRYSFNVKEILNNNGTNRLEVQITSPIHAAVKLASENSYTPPNCPPERYNGECHMNFLRKMQASFSWDWGLAAPSMGIWKPVTLEFYDIAIIRDVDVAVSKSSINDDWILDIKVYLESAIATEFYGNLTLYAVEINSSPFKISFNKEPIKDFVIAFNQTIENNKVELWWPNGYGKQKLYQLHFTLDTWSKKAEPTQLTVSQKSISIGFRTIELVQDPIENGRSFYFRVNNIPIFMKGTNYIPSHILPELGQDQRRIKHLLESVKYSHMNMIRVWGGGVYESDYFYDMADNLGILIWQDMMFACAMYPAYPEFLNSVKVEVAQNAKRIGHHASIAIITANNENELALIQHWYGTAGDSNRFYKEYIQLYNNTVLQELTIISHKSRPQPLMSSPSNGDNNMLSDPGSNKFGDLHFYNYEEDGWDPKIYPTPRFSSEYGFQSFPAMSSWQKVLGKHDDLKMLIYHRQHFPFGSRPILSLIRRHLPLPWKGSSKFVQAIIYFSQIAQAMAMKTETEVYRKSRNTTFNTMGALYWQLNDVWVAPTWSSIDFFGNYKILHHWAKQFMAPITIIAHERNDINLDIYVVRDTIDNDILDMKIIYKIYSWDKLYPNWKKSFRIKIEPNTAKLVKTIDINELERNGPNALDSKSFFIEFSLKYNNTVLSKTYYFPNKIKNAIGMQDPNIKFDICSTICKGSLCSNNISITVDYPAIFVYLDIQHDNISTYKLSDNGFIQLERTRLVYLEYENQSHVDISKSNIKILTLNEFMYKPSFWTYLF